MMSDSEHHPLYCFITSAFHDGARFTFTGSLALSLFFHLAAFSAYALLKANANQTHPSGAVIEIDLSAIETARSADTLSSPVSAARQKPERNPGIRDRAASVRRNRSASEKTTLKSMENPVPAPGPRTATELKTDDARTGNDSAGAVVSAAASNAGPTGTVSGEESESGGKRKGDGDGETERHGGDGHGAKGALAEYSRAIRALIERHKEYPHAARKLGIHGSVVVSFSLNCRGELQGVSLTKSSGNSMLDNAGIRAVRDVGSFPPPPRHAMQGESVSFRIPIKFALAAG
jgi:protein TonB